MTQEKNKFIILKLLILSSTLPFLLIINASDFKNFSDFIYSSSLIFGYIGISLLFWMQFLGHRKLTSLFFKDLPRTIKLHSFIGKYGTILIFLHPILLAYSYSEDIFKYIFTFSLASEYQIGLTFGKIVFYILLITWISSAILQSKIKFRPWKYLHYLTYLALPLSILHVPNVGGSNWKNLAIQSYWYLLIICYLALLILRIAFQFGYSKRKYKIKNLVKTASNSYHITLENIDKKPLALNHFEGQYIYLQKKNLGLEHPFSIIKNDSKILELGFKPFGKFSSWLSQAEIGSTLYVDGPYGNFLQNIEKKKFEFEIKAKIKPEFNILKEK
jgi:predicted ferric reductase